MTFNPDIHHRRSIRLRDYDYAVGGAYFVTICTWERECLFGEVLDGGMQLSGFGEFVRDEWLNTAIHRSNVVLDEFVIMPNHFHGIICLTNVVGARRAPAMESFGKPVSGSLSTIVRSFKSAVTKRINELRNNPGGLVWQRNYYERVIRNDSELDRARDYIMNNPLQWDDDENNPATP